MEAKFGPEARRCMACRGRPLWSSPPTDFASLQKANTSMNSSYWIVGIACLALVLLFTGCTSVGKPMRVNPATGAAPADAWYIESKPTDGSRPFSCSFVEYDGHGDYIDFEQ